jgi:DNA-binding beta-propeller fold protein YncE
MQPVCLCLSHNNKRLFVTDGENHVILVLNRADGTVIQEIGNGKGKAPGQFNSPWGICISPDGRELYASDKNNHRIQVFNAADGSYVRSIGNGQFKYPKGICVSRNGEELYVSDNRDVKVLRITDGTILRTFEVDDPDGLCLSQDNELLFVAGQKNIVVFRVSNGSYVRPIFTRFGDDEQEDSELSGICLSPNGEELFVTDGLYSHVRVLRADDGSLIQTIGGHGQSDGKFVTPLGVCVSRDGEMIVADTWNYRIQVFQM